MGSSRDSSPRILDVNGDDGYIRGLLSTPQARTANWTTLACHATRLTFLLSHGMVVLSFAASLENLDQASWWLIWLPAWIGDSICMGLLIFSWFSSCPYLKLCVAERMPRVGIDNPSMLTEILPEIV